MGHGELLRRHGGVVSARCLGLYRQTELARQMFADELAGAARKGCSPGKPVAEELLGFGASGGEPEIVRMALERIDGRGTTCVVPIPGSRCFWHHIPWLLREIANSDRGTYFRASALFCERCDPNLIGLSAGRRYMRSPRCGIT